MAQVSPTHGDQCVMKGPIAADTVFIETIPVLCLIETPERERRAEPPGICRTVTIRNDSCDGPTAARAGRRSLAWIDATFTGANGNRDRAARKSRAAPPASRTL